jgi:hypothetical protein
MRHDAHEHAATSAVEEPCIPERNRDRSQEVEGAGTKGRQEERRMLDRGPETSERQESPRDDVGQDEERNERVALSTVIRSFLSPT